MNTLLEDVELTGTITFSSELLIQAKIDGEIISPAVLTVGDKAHINGDIKVRSTVVFGKIEGTITAQERCDLKATSTVIGDITAGTLAVEEGATFAGSSKVGKAAVGK